MKRICSLLSAILIFTLLITSCTEGRGGDILTFDACGIDTVPLSKERTLTVDGHMIVYRNVYNDGEGNFVFAEGGYIKTVGGCPDSLMRFSAKPGVHVYKITPDTDLRDPGFQLKGDMIDKEHVRYVVSTSFDVMITYNKPFGTTSSEKANIGRISFWC